MRMRDISDEILVASCLEGDRRAWKEFWNRFLKQIHTFAVRIFELDQRDVRGFLNHAVERIHSGMILPGYPGDEPFPAWFRTTLRTLLSEYLADSYGPPPAPASRRSGKRDAPKAIEEPKTIQFARVLEVKQCFAALALEDRVLVKLALAWYFRFTAEELDYLARQNRCTSLEILKQLRTLRHDLAVTNGRLIELENARITALQDLIAGELHLAALYRRQRNMEASHNIDLSLISVIGDIQQELSGTETRLMKQFDTQAHETTLLRTPIAMIVALLKGRSSEAVLEKRLLQLYRQLTPVYEANP